MGYKCHFAAEKLNFTHQSMIDTLLGWKCFN